MTKKYTPADILHGIEPWVAAREVSSGIEEGRTAGERTAHS